MLPEIVPGSIDVQAPQQLSIPVEGDEGFDEDVSLSTHGGNNKRSHAAHLRPRSS